jgi:hypothetical protein
MMPVTDLWAKMFLRFDEDPKIVALARYGDEAGLCRDLYLAMVRYCRRNLTDGFVPTYELMRLAFPLALPMAERIAKHLVSEELCAEVPNGWVVSAYVKRNGTRAQQEAKSETARELARRRWSADANGSADRSAGGSAAPNAVGNAEVETEVEDRRGARRDPPARASARTGARAREEPAATDDEDSTDELANTIVALLHAHGPITRDQAAAYRERVLAGRNVEDPAAYVIGAIRRDPRGAYREAVQAAPRAGKAQPPPPSMICRRCGAIGEHREADCPKPPPSDDASKHGAAEARRLLAEKGITGKVISDEPNDPGATRVTRPDPGATPVTPREPPPEQPELPAEPEPAEEGDEEFDPPF